MEILIWVLIFGFGLCIGFLIKWWLTHRANYGGVIYVSRHDGKTLYSLVLSDYPEKIELRKTILFKVDVPSDISLVVDGPVEES